MRFVRIVPKHHIAHCPHKLALISQPLSFERSRQSAGGLRQIFDNNTRAGSRFEPLHPIPSHFLGQHGGLLECWPKKAPKFWRRPRLQWKRRHSNRQDEPLSDIKLELQKPGLGGNDRWDFDLSLQLAKCSLHQKTSANQW